MMAQASQGSGQLLSAEGSVSGHVTIASTGTVGISDTGGSPSSCVQSAQQTLQAALSTAQKTTPLWLRVAEELVAYATYYITVSDC
jgi:hypothetical protein